jgi:hypothetical protein
MNFLKKLGHSLEKAFRPITKIAAVAGLAYASYGTFGAAGSAQVATALINGRRQSSGAPLPQENVAPYGVGGQVYTQSREPYSSPAVPSSSFVGGGGYSGPSDSGAPAPSGMNPLVIGGIVVAGGIVLILMLRR